MCILSILMRTGMHAYCIGCIETYLTYLFHFTHVHLFCRLRNPSELNGLPMHQLTLRTLEKNANEEDILGLIDRLSSQGQSAVNHLDNLPHFSTKAFGKLMHNLRQAQLLAVQRLVGQ